jgi:hypothetical protein
VHLIATPAFDAPGCHGARYSSVLVVSARAQARGATTLAACRGLRAAINGDDSHSGMNALRDAVAPHAHDGRFFASVASFGSHLNVLRALAAGHADCAAIDCVTFAYVGDALPALLDEIRIVGMTAPAPGLPPIASKALDGGLVKPLWMRSRMRSRSIATARVLRLKGFESGAARIRRDCAVRAAGGGARLSGAGRTRRCGARSAAPLAVIRRPSGAP